MTEGEKPQTVDKHLNKPVLPVVKKGDIGIFGGEETGSERKPSGNTEGMFWSVPGGGVKAKTDAKPVKPQTVAKDSGRKGSNNPEGEQI